MEPVKRESSVREIQMRRVILALLIASGVAALGTAPSEAVGTRYPFCIQGDEQPGLSNCTFTSYEQCQATALRAQIVLRRKSLLCRREKRRPAFRLSAPSRPYVPPAYGAPRY